MLTTKGDSKPFASVPMMHYTLRIVRDGKTCERSIVGWHFINYDVRNSNCSQTVVNSLDSA